MPGGLDFLNSESPLSLGLLLLNLAVGVPLALLVSWHFRRFGSTLSNRAEFAQVFPFVILTTILIITVVKSSLALSLGLVGALSIVRFRTPIKEPEELAYLFISIAIGLGLGASQTVPTIVATLAILTVMAVIGWYRGESLGKSIFLSVDVPTQEEQQVRDVALPKLNEIITRHSTGTDLRRFDMRNGTLETTYLIDVSHPDQLAQLAGEVRSSFPEAAISVLDRGRLPSG